MATVVWTLDHSDSPPETEASSIQGADGSKNEKNEKNENVRVVVEPLPLGEPLKDTKKYWWPRSRPVDPDAIATQISVYDDPEVAKLYIPRPDCENLHRFDPSARWTWREEKALVRKIDLRIFLFACVAFMSLEIDRANLTQAVSDNFLKDLKLTTNDYNLGNTVFTASFMCAELPSQLVSKWMGPDRWIPMQMILWSIVAASQFKLNGRASFLATRSLLGILQGGFIPDMNLYLSCFYSSAELPGRLSCWWSTMTSAIIIGAFMAFGILHLDGKHGVEGWRWLFLIEGIFTAVASLSAFFFMPASPTQTAGRLRGKKGWFTARDETIIVNRALRNNPSKETMHNRQPITPYLLLKSLKDYHLWPIYLIGLVFQMPMGPPNQYLTLSLKGLGFDTFQTNLLDIPSQVLSIINLLAFTQLAGLTNGLAFNGIIGQVQASAPILNYSIISLVKCGHCHFSSPFTYLLLGYPSNHSVQVGWASRNANTVRTRTVSTAMYNMCAQAGSIVYSNIYRADDAPRYRRGNKDLIGIVSRNIVLCLVVNFYYDWVNKRRDKIWNAWTPEGRENYLQTTKDEGSNRLDFRFTR
ncbi:MFS general substrate transporter [Mollisia scopiformis]|uniref:MFS general substrate transporter n=1 Tax=Mollisia scopiformis TaxID=149040 RepID=A0A194WZ50_MOLSC|nr:MFS general substrate transporter [Mollisia scopiformis]KUJ12867.1 MFS general substrate transporter [Mollisia scopiformis]